MTLTYDFDNNGFEYELTSEDIKGYLKEQDVAALADCAEEVFVEMSEEERNSIINSILDDGDVELLTKKQIGDEVRYGINWEVLFDIGDWSWAYETFLSKNLEYFEDDMKDYFHSAASDCYDAQRDPLGYRGLSMRDFY